ncbi:MAG: hypothetical protein NT134_02785 [Chloroflexi bacterium]|nr:hypothetical protein [Chloroflexota bacterium]
MPEEPKFENSELIHLLDIVNQRLRHLHDSLWKEETHYTWLSYILVGGLIYLLVISRQTSLDLLTAIGFFLLAFFLSIIGIFICIMGFNVIRLEGKYFHTAIEIRNRLHLALKLDKYYVEGKRIFPDTKYYNELEVKDWKEVEKAANKCLGQLLNCEALKEQLICLKEPEEKSEKYTIRDLFQLTMLLPLTIFCTALIYSVVTFILYLVNL